MATAERTKFIRPDGKDKVTGLGRYTADLTMTGMLHACFRYADHAHARIRSIDTARARALPGAFCVLTQDDVPDVRYVPFVEYRTLFARDVVRYGARLSRRWRPRPPRSPLGRGADRRRLRAAAGRERRRGRARGRRRWCTRGGRVTRPPRTSSGDNDASRSDDREGRRRGSAARRPMRSWKERYAADMSHVAPIGPTRGGRPSGKGDRVTVWSCTEVPYIACSGVATTLEMPESLVSASSLPASRAVGSAGSWPVPLRGARGRPAGATERPARVLAQRGVHCPRHHRREGQVIELETGAMRDGTHRGPARPENPS